MTVNRLIVLVGQLHLLLHLLGLVQGFVGIGYTGSLSRGI